MFEHTLYNSLLYDPREPGVDGEKTFMFSYCQYVATEPYWLESQRLVRLVYRRDRK